MGYYTGSGVTSSGGSSVSVLEHFIFYGAHNVYQKTVTTVTRKSGVSLNTAQGTQGDSNMSLCQFAYGTLFTHYTPNGKGTSRNVTYSQINGSNLYEMLITNNVISAKADDGQWQNP